MATAKVDLSEVLVGLNALGELSTSLARSMVVAGGKVIRDEAKARVPVKTGRLRDAIYLAYKDTSTKTDIRYSVTWNSREAPHGHLVEFGHWQYRGKAKKGATRGRFVPAKPFLRPALDAARGRAFQAMIERGKVRFAELLKQRTQESGRAMRKPQAE